MTLHERLPFARAGAELIRRGALTWLCAFAVFAGCSESPLSPHEQQLLRQAFSKWHEEDRLDYTIEARISCFCPPYLAQWTRLTVRNGIIVDADPVESLPDGVEPGLLGWLTVEDEFERLLSPPGILEEIEARFDSRYGYPTYIRSDCGPNVQDCGSVHEMRNLRFPILPAIRS
jgi:hypothetical protein